MTQLFPFKHATLLAAMRVLIYALLLSSSLMAFSCKPQGSASPNAKRYDLKGQVVAVDKAEHRVTIAHDEIAGYMDAMTMPFAVRQNDYWAMDVLSPGQNVSATLVVDNGLTWIENIVITEQSAVDTNASNKEGLPREA